MPKNQRNFNNLLPGESAASSASEVSIYKSYKWKQTKEVVD